MVRVYCPVKLFIKVELTTVALQNIFKINFDGKQMKINLKETRSVTMNNFRKDIFFLNHL